MSVSHEPRKGKGQQYAKPMFAVLHAHIRMRHLCFIHLGFVLQTAEELQQVQCVAQSEETGLTLWRLQMPEEIPMHRHVRRQDLVLAGSGRQISREGIVTIFDL